MAKTSAAEVEAGGRSVRVSSPDRIIYEATDRTPDVTKLMVAEYFASVEDGLMRALRDLDVQIDVVPLLFIAAGIALLASAWRPPRPAERTTRADLPPSPPAA